MVSDFGAPHSQTIAQTGAGLSRPTPIWDIDCESEVSDARMSFRLIDPLLRAPVTTLLNDVPSESPFCQMQE